MSDYDLVVTGRVVRTDRVIDGGYVAIRDGLVERVGEGPAPQASERHDFGNAYRAAGRDRLAGAFALAARPGGFHLVDARGGGRRRHHHRRHAL